jgi:hypothetical protein
MTLDRQEKPPQWGIERERQHEARGGNGATPLCFGSMLPALFDHGAIAEPKSACASRKSTLQPQYSG